ncbi:MAG: flagellar brake domain-containing protein [candidate division Zixibacteria bacterium]
MALSTKKTTANKVQVWERLQIAVGETGKEGIYSCRVMDIENRRLIISRPEFMYGDSLLANNRIVSVRFTRADAAYSFRARLKELHPKSPETMHLTELGRVQRLQRRRFVRLDKMMPVKYFVPKRPIKETLDISKVKYLDSKTINISAGGLLMTTEEKINLNTLMVIDLTHINIKNLPSYVIAVCRQARHSDKRKWMTGVEFILAEDLPKFLRNPELSCIPDNLKDFYDRRQNELVSELFNEQLEMRQKGII